MLKIFMIAGSLVLPVAVSAPAHAADDARIRTCIAVVPTITAVLDQFIQTKEMIQTRHTTTYGGSGKEEVEKQLQDLDKGIANFQAQLAACTK